MDDGEDVFFRLDENLPRLDELLNGESPREHILAASALCQLADPSPSCT